MSRDIFSYLRRVESGSSISQFIFTKPYFSYKALPISVVSREMAVIPFIKTIP